MSPKKNKISCTFQIHRFKNKKDKRKINNNVARKSPMNFLKKSSPFIETRKMKKKQNIMRNVKIIYMPKIKLKKKHIIIHYYST
jgi:hypothetical protein